jgi:hypothetical protein
MELLSLSLLLITLTIYDEIFNGQMKISQKLLNWFENRDSNTSNNSKNFKN